MDSALQQHRGSNVEFIAVLVQNRGSNIGFSAALKKTVNPTLDLAPR